MIKGQRQWNHPVDFNATQYRNDLVTQLAGRDNRDTGRGDDRRGIAAGELAEIRQDNGVVL